MNKSIMMIALTAILMLGVLSPLAFAEDAVVGDVDATDEVPMLISAAPTEQAEIESEADASLDTTESTNGLKLGLRQVEIWFTFNQEKRAEKELDLARLRLIQAKVAAQNNNSVAMEKALEAHEKIMNRVRERAEKLENANKSSNLTGLARAIEVHEARIQKMNSLLADTNLTEAQRTRIEARINQATEVTGSLTEIQSRIQERIQNRLANETEDTEELETETEEETESNESNSKTGAGNGNQAGQA